MNVKNKLTLKKKQLMSSLKNMLSNKESGKTSIFIPAGAGVLVLIAIIVALMLFVFNNNETEDESNPVETSEDEQTNEDGSIDNATPSETNDSPDSNLNEPEDEQTDEGNSADNTTPSEANNSSNDNPSEDSELFSSGLNALQITNLNRVQEVNAEEIASLKKEIADAKQEFLNELKKLNIEESEIASFIQAIDLLNNEENLEKLLTVSEEEALAYTTQINTLTTDLTADFLVCLSALNTDLTVNDANYELQEEIVVNCTIEFIENMGQGLLGVLNPLLNS